MPSRNSPDADPVVDRLWGVLDRQVDTGALEQLHRSISGQTPTLAPGTRFALGFDTNAVFRLGLGPDGPDAVDYVAAAHEGPLVIPGQTIQEVWNNSLAAVRPQAQIVRTKFGELESALEKIGVHVGSIADDIRTALRDLSDIHGDWIAPESLGVFESTLKQLLTKGQVSYVPRDRFLSLAKARKETKTPPGFEDPIGYGDFYVWADFLLGVALAVETYDAVVLVTNDTKIDWSRNGVAHPILVAEAETFTGVPFYLWDLRQFQVYARSAMAAQ